MSCTHCRTNNIQTIIKKSRPKINAEDGNVIFKRKPTTTEIKAIGEKVSVRRNNIMAEMDIIYKRFIQKSFWKIQFIIIITIILLNSRFEHFYFTYSLTNMRKHVLLIKK